MLGEAFERLPAEVEPVEIGVRSFQPGDDADGVGIVVEPADVGERGGQRVFASMAEWRVAEVVGEAQGLGQILIEAERAGDRPADLRDLDAVRQADPEMIAIGRDEHLGLVAQATESDRMDDPVAVALEDVARPAGAGSLSDEVCRAMSRVWRQALRRLIQCRLAQSGRFRNWSSEMS